MAAATVVVTVHDGIIPVPDELKVDPRFQDGTQVKLTLIESGPVLKAVKDWRDYEGLYFDPTFDATVWKQQEREFELDHDERKFGTKPTW